MNSTYITTTIPYVNARPHLGFALELVQADVLARYRRGAGEQVRFQAGTDDNSLKNVLAAEAAGVGVQEFVDANAAAFTGLAQPLHLSADDLIRTSSDPRHRAGVERLWRACAARGDLYRRHYEGLYCVGCEQFYTAAELDDGRCPEHGTVPDLVSEENWFFRLSRYAGELRTLVRDGTIRIEPAERRNEVLALIDSGLTDFSVSRSTERARGWGIPVPGDPGQVIYVWWDALGNYLTALDYAAGGDSLDRWWAGASRRYVNRTRPWSLAKAGEAEELAAVLLALLRACQAIGTLLLPFLPQAASRITQQLIQNEGGFLPAPSPVFPRLD